MTTAIVCPLASELAGVLAVTTARRVLRLHRGGGRRLRVTLGRLAGEEVALAATGDGPAAAAAALEALAGALRPRRLLVLGVAGGLTPGLAGGTLVAARRVLAADGSPMPRHPDEGWLAQALRCGAIAGIAVSAERILADPLAKQSALRMLPAADLASASAGLSAAGCAASRAPIPIATVDLESAAYARVAAAFSLPYLVVRSVLDTAEETLPLDFEACRGSGGGVGSARVIVRALAHPGVVADLWRLRSRVEEASLRLAALAVLLVGAPAGGAAAARIGAVPSGEPRAPESAVAAVAGGRRA
jgi:adenosylhomocysteine nucleosidase